MKKIKVHGMHRCCICSGADAGSVCLSKVILKPGYGSKHDMEQRTVYVCGECMDWIYDCFDRRKENEK